MYLLVDINCNEPQASSSRPPEKHDWTPSRHCGQLASHNWCDSCEGWAEGRACYWFLGTYAGPKIKVEGFQSVGVFAEWMEWRCRSRCFIFPTVLGSDDFNGLGFQSNDLGIAVICDIFF